MKVPVVAPAATVKLAGTVAEVELDPNVTTRPPAGAAAESVTVAVLGNPAFTVVGFRARVFTVCAEPRAGTSIASSKKINCIGNLIVCRALEICSVCGIDVPQTRIRGSRVPSFEFP